MYCSQSMVVTVYQCVCHCLPEGSHVHFGHWYTKQPYLDFTLRVIRAKVRLQPLQALKQREMTELVECHRFACKYLKGELMRRNQLSECWFTPDQEQARQRRRAGTVGLTCSKTECAIQRFVIQLQQHTVATVLLHTLT